VVSAARAGCRWTTGQLHEPRNDPVAEAASSRAVACEPLGEAIARRAGGQTIGRGLPLSLLGICGRSTGSGRRPLSAGKAIHTAVAWSNDSISWAAAEARRQFDCLNRGHAARDTRRCSRSGTVSRPVDSPGVPPELGWVSRVLRGSVSCASAGRLARTATGLALAVLCASCGGVSRDAGAVGLPFGPFAGYQWNGAVSSVQGSWMVPAILGGRQSGGAATWIAAEAIGPVPSPIAPLIQVGTTELEVRTGKGPPHSQYYAFWADAVHGFRAIPLFIVQPHDRVSARLVLAGGRWRLSIRDERSGRSASLSTRDETTATFRLALWTQEDVSTELTPRRIASYPRLSATRFDHVSVNGEPLAASRVNVVWMSLGPVVLRPTGLRDNSFSLRLERPQLNGVQLRYLAVVAHTMSEISRGQVELAAATTDSSRSELQSAAKLEHGLQQRIMGLRAASWPEPARRSINDYVSALTALLAATKATNEIAATGFQAWRTTWSRAATSLQLAAAAARRALDVPGFQPG
jgi:hypothetical protein